MKILEAMSTIAGWILLLVALPVTLLFILFGAGPGYAIAALLVVVVILLAVIAVKVGRK
jgi:hypothetical protein